MGDWIIIPEKVVQGIKEVCFNEYKKKQLLRESCRHYLILLLMGYLLMIPHYPNTTKHEWIF